MQNSFALNMNRTNLTVRIDTSGNIRGANLAKQTKQFLAIFRGVIWLVVLASSSSKILYQSNRTTSASPIFQIQF